MYRQQQRLKHGDTGKRDELERKEKGFMLYVNGANALPSGGKTARTARRPKSSLKIATDEGKAAGHFNVELLPLCLLNVSFCFFM